MCKWTPKIVTYCHTDLCPKQMQQLKSGEKRKTQMFAVKKHPHGLHSQDSNHVVWDGSVCAACVGVSVCVCVCDTHAHVEGSDVSAAAGLSGSEVTSLHVQ